MVIIAGEDRQVNTDLKEIVQIGKTLSERELTDAVERRATDPGNVLIYAIARKGGDFVPFYWLGGNIGGPLGGKKNEWPIIISETENDKIGFRASRLQADGSIKSINAFGRKAVFLGPEIEGSGTRSEYHLMVGRNSEDASDVREWLFFATAAFVCASVVTGLIIGIVLAQNFFYRTEGIRQTALSIMDGDLSRRIDVSPKLDEFDRLSALLNSMLDQIQNLLSGMKEVSDNIAHDLRTPLNRLKSRLELAQVDIEQRRGGREASRQAIDMSLRETEGLLETFNALLRIARLEAGAVADEMCVIEAAPIVRDVVELYEPLAEEEGLLVSTSLESDLYVSANRELLSQALANLIENAIKYSPAQTTVHVGLRRVGDKIIFNVRDSGPGIAPEDRDRVLKRFVRLDRGRGAPGSGLGLSLVSAIVQLHQGVLTLADAVEPNGSDTNIAQTGLNVSVALSARTP